MYERIIINVKISRGETKNFSIGIRLHQGLTLISYLFNPAYQELIKDYP